MSIVKSGMICDVCGFHVLLEPTFERLKVSGIEQELHCHNKCRKPVEEAGGDWTKLPEGPLKVAFAEAAAKLEKGKIANKAYLLTRHDRLPDVQSLCEKHRQRFIAQCFCVQEQPTATIELIYCDQCKEDKYTRNEDVPRE